MKIYQAPSRSSISQPARAKNGTVNSIIVDDCQSEAAHNSTILSGHIKRAPEESPSTSSIHTEDDIDRAVSEIKCPTDKGYFDDHRIECKTQLTLLVNNGACKPSQTDFTGNKFPIMANANDKKNRRFSSHPYYLTNNLGEMVARS